MTVPARLRTPAGPFRPREAGAGGRIPVATVGIAVAMLLSFGFGPNLYLALVALAMLVAGSVPLWRPGESPVLILIFGLHRFGASVAVFHANWLDIDILHYSNFGGDMHLATMLSLVGVLIVALGMRVGAGAWRPREAEMARSIALAHPLKRWFHLYCLAWAVSFVSLSLVWVVPGLSQVMLAVAAMRWAFFFVLAYAAFAQGGLAQGGLASPYLLVAFGAELAVSLGNYFSDFRTVFLFTICTAFASGLRMTARVQATLAVLVGALLCLGIVWTGIKEDYRSFVAEGRKEQVVTIDYVTRMAKLGELAGALDARAVAAGFDKMLQRLSYVEYFSAVLGVVPNQIGHENGALIGDALARPFLPRALFPEKAAINDTDRTNLYTGGLAGESEGTSISIGYIGESYIDFGAYGMMAALFGIGCGYGFAYRLLSRSPRCGSLIGMGLASAVLMTVGGLESSFTKVAGGFVACLLVAWLFVRFVVPFSLRWVTAPGGGR